MKLTRAKTQDRTEEIRMELVELKELKAQVRQQKRNFRKNFGMRPPLNNEYAIQDHLEAYLKLHDIPYKREVHIKNGRIDFMTDKELIEVKKLWQHQHLYQAIGQLHYYNKSTGEKYRLVVCSEQFTPVQEEILMSLNIEARVI